MLNVVTGKSPVPSSFCHSLYVARFICRRASKFQISTSKIKNQKSEIKTKNKKIKKSKNQKKIKKSKFTNVQI